MKVKTAELVGSALNWAVAMCEGYSGKCLYLSDFMPDGIDEETDYLTNWAQGGPIIEREKIRIIPSPPSRELFWIAGIYDKVESFGSDSPTPLIAAMRCYVASKLGDTIEIPEEL